MDKNIWLHSPVERICPLCESDDTFRLSSKMQYGLDLSTVICSKCGMVFTNPVPTEEMYNRFYTEAYADYYGNIAAGAPSTSEQVEPTHIANIFSTIERFTEVNGRKLLEVGPGKGQFLYWAKKHGADVLGIEPSLTFHNMLTKRNLPSINGTLEDNIAKLDSEAWDFIFMSNVLEHFYDANRALSMCRSLLVDDGLLIIIVPNILKPYRSLDRYFLRYVHPSNFSPDTLRSILGKHGFSVIQSDTFGAKRWNQPHSLFIIAEKKSTLPDSFSLPSRKAEEVLEILRKYRLYWRYIKGPAWHINAKYILLKRLLIRAIRWFKRRLLKTR